MTRKEQILEARSYLKNSVQEYGFSLGAEWADENPDQLCNHSKDWKSTHEMLAIAEEALKIITQGIWGPELLAKEALAEISELKK